jgi:hypothetical protein
MNYSKSEGEIDLKVAGHYRPLFYSPGTSSCGSIRDGVAFRFGGEACWVVSLETLRKIVESEDARRSPALSKRDN